jgi:hypothetical protein
MWLCDPDWIRTNDLLLRRQLLYPTELRDQTIWFKVQSLKIKVIATLNFRL